VRLICIADEIVVKVTNPTANKMICENCKKHSANFHLTFMGSDNTRTQVQHLCAACFERLHPEKASQAENSPGKASEKTSE
jgi:protein-arginine kinase activator protein McsA